VNVRNERDETQNASGRLFQYCADVPPVHDAIPCYQCHPMPWSPWSRSIKWNQLPTSVLSSDLTLLTFNYQSEYTAAPALTTAGFNNILWHSCVTISAILAPNTSYLTQSHTPSTNNYICTVNRMN